MVHSVAVRSLRSAVLMALGAASVWSASVWAQDGSLEEIVVTAQKREQSLQDVGVSVSAFGGEQLKSLGVADAKDIARLAPGVVFDSTASGSVNANLTVRGVSQSDFSSNQESPNSIYIDEIYLSSPSAAAFTFYDLERVEVLRGPQGTLFGRNSTGGLAHFITAKPTESFEGYAEAGFGRFNQAYFEGAVSGPISDRVRGRLSARYDRNDGWWKNHNPDGKDLMEKRFRGVRGQIEADLTDEFTARLVVSYDGNPKHREGTYKIRNFYYDANGQPAPLPADLDAWGTGPGNNFVGYRDPYPDGPESSTDNHGFLVNRRFTPTLTLNWQRGDTTITSLTNYTNFSFAYNEECDGSPIDYCQFPFGQKLEQWSEELRATGRAGSVTWTTGVYYLKVEQDVYIGFNFPLLAGSDFAFDDINNLTQDTTSFAPFAQIEWDVTDRVRLTLGARYTRDKKTIDSKVFFNELGNGYSGGTGTTIFDPPLLVYDFSEATVGDLAKSKEGLWSGKVQLDYRLGDGKLLYAGLSRGVKGSGFNTNVSGNLTNPETPFESELVYAYEVGGKFEMLDRRLRVNGSFFYYDYKDFQGFAFNGLQGVVGNYDGKFYGGELELAASLPGRFRVDLGASYIHSRLQDIPTAYTGIRDQQSIMAPKWTVNGMVRKGFALGPGELGLQWSFDFVDDRYASVDNNAATFIGGSFVHNARLTYDLDESGLQFAVFVDNISDKARKNFTYDLIVTGGYNIDSYAKPRWWGASVRKRF